ncbi:Abi family protein [Yersinia massiliensis]|uniref:Abi family protein n=1 Tax=Yersinia massiliensis TaxID=419257 RepID=UPI0011A46159|nr:Abi family protein [Yersinia massiliensis]HDL6777764.1 Abi family protein [Yersinia enterocolitica]HDL8500528.1 Abi family protein [Yersinia enterocolitica]
MSIEPFINTDRLDIYVKHLKIDPSQVMSAYYWNKSLCGAMLPALQCLEVTLRNALDQAIQADPPPAAVAQNLWRTDHNWIFDLPRYMGDKAFPKNNYRYKRPIKAGEPRDPQGFLLDQYGNRVYKNKLTIEKQIDITKDEIAKMRKPITPNRVISGLSFGVWTQFLTRYYENKSGTHKTLLWPHLTRKVFPNAPAHFGRNEICDAFIRIKSLRNRLSHHEAIWKFHYDDPATRLPDYSNPVYGAQASCSLLRKHYDDIIDMIGWMSTARKVNFLAHSAGLRFYALCSVDGLHSYIDPEKIAAKIQITRGGKGIGRIVKVLERNEFVRIVKGGKTVLTFGADSSMALP